MFRRCLRDGAAPCQHVRHTSFATVLQRSQCRVHSLAQRGEQRVVRQIHRGRAVVVVGIVCVLGAAARGLVTLLAGSLCKPREQMRSWRQPTRNAPPPPASPSWPWSSCSRPASSWAAREGERKQRQKKNTKKNKTIEPTWAAHSCAVRSALTCWRPARAGSISTCTNASVHHHCKVGVVCAFAPCGPP